ncbi:nuclear transport factor 2 family protein [Nesterenkonia ebinurensis]|uniref:nuclear transport factor 2 family protein n=1 Tax=Nesterenkonia ebinurensis TaxID=2608252 RepID=UPI00123C8501|nr:nuclear transport factor 2 family protein [Nesterenkonia ebinurensis]
MSIASEQIEAVVRRYYQLVDAQDLALLETFHDDATYKRPGYAEFRGHDELREFYSGERIIDAGAHTIGQLFIHGPHAAVEGSFTGTLKDGRSVELAFSDFFDLQERAGEVRIAARRTYFDDQQV